MVNLAQDRSPMLSTGSCDCCVDAQRAARSYSGRALMQPYRPQLRSVEIKDPRSARLCRRQLERLDVYGRIGALLALRRQDSGRARDLVEGLVPASGDTS